MADLADQKFRKKIVGLSLITASALWNRKHESQVPILGRFYAEKFTDKLVVEPSKYTLHVHGLLE